MWRDCKPQPPIRKSTPLTTWPLGFNITNKQSLSLGRSWIRRRRTGHVVLPVGDLHAALPSRHLHFALQSLEVHGGRTHQGFRHRRPRGHHAEGGIEVRRGDRDGGRRREVRQVLQVHLAPQQLVLCKVRRLRDLERGNSVAELLGHGQVSRGKVSILRVERLRLSSAFKVRIKLLSVCYSFVANAQSIIDSKRLWNYVS